jgi:serine-type D-Ala-D-Ala carboxypeptidase
VKWLPLGLIALAGCAHGGGIGSSGLISSDTRDWRHVKEFLDSAVAAGAAPGAVLGVTVAGKRFIYGTGRLGQDDSARPAPNTVYDLASVTKVIALTSAIMLGIEEGKLQLDAPVQDYVPAFIGVDKERVTLRLLLAHVSGMPAWKPLFREVSSRADAFAVVDSIQLDTVPATRDVYSDLGAILLTQAVEAAFHQRIDSLVTRRILEPLKMESTRFLPPPSWMGRIAPTELDPWRGRVLRGEVHDENAAIMDGVSGHAGLFGSADDLLTFSEWMLQQWNDVMPGGDQAHVTAGGPPSISAGLVREFTRRQNIVPGSSRALGWDTPEPGSSSGTLLSGDSFGHTGFTGTSLWIDPDHHLAVVLLSNRVNPTRANTRWNPVRARITDLIMTTLFQDAR